jgi:hypothetical protein
VSSLASVAVVVDHHTANDATFHRCVVS